MLSVAMRSATSPPMMLLAAEDPLHHNYDYPILTYNGWSVLTNHSLLMLCVAVFMLWAMPKAAKSISTGKTGTSADYVPGNIGAHLVEVLCVFFREQVARPVLGENTDKFIPFIWTVFFFILLNNLVGLVPLLDITSLAINPLVGGDESAEVAVVTPSHADPMTFDQAGHDGGGAHDEASAAAGHDAHEGTTGFVWFRDVVTGHSHFHGIGGTATGNIFVTAAMAFISACVIIGSGIKSLGLGGFLDHLTLGTKLPLSILMVFLELIGLVAKPFALTVRLFANMTAGHVMLAVLIGFCGMAFSGTGPAWGTAISIPSLAFAFAISLLELLVAFIQAYIFTFLTTMFISLFQHQGHEHAEEHGHGYEESHGHAVAAVAAGGAGRH